MYLDELRFGLYLIGIKMFKSQIRVLAKVIARLSISKDMDMNHVPLTLIQEEKRKLAEQKLTEELTILREIK